MKAAARTTSDPSSPAIGRPRTIIDLRAYRRVSRKSMQLIVVISLTATTALVFLFVSNYRFGTIVACAAGTLLGVLPTLYVWRGHPQAGPAAMIGIAYGLILISIALWLYVLVAGVPMPDVSPYT